MARKTDSRDVRISSLVMLPQGMFVTASEALAEFVVRLTPTTEGVFRRMREPAIGGVSTGQATFEWCGERPVRASARHPSASAQGVLWSRREAIEAQQAIDAYRQDLDRRMQRAALDVAVARYVAHRERRAIAAEMRADLAATAYVPATWRPDYDVFRELAVEFIRQGYGPKEAAEAAGEVHRRLDNLVSTYGAVLDATTAAAVAPSVAPDTPLPDSPAFRQYRAATADRLRRLREVVQAGTKLLAELARANIAADTRADLTDNAVAPFTPSIGRIEFDALRDLAVEFIRQGRSPDEAVEAADETYRRLDRVAVTYSQALDAPEAPKE